MPLSVSFVIIACENSNKACHTQPVHTTQRLQLNLLSGDDREFMLSLVNSKGWLQFIGDRNVRSLDDASAYINKVMNTTNLFYWVVRLKEDQTPVGIISFLKR